MDSLDKFKNDAWHLDDRLWMESRKRKWADLEPVLRAYAKPTKRGLTPVKNYFLTGRLPDWNKYRDWDNYDRHLDLFCFLWLHPSKDRSDIKKLFDMYMNSEGPLNEDIAVGYQLFLNFFDECAHNPSNKTPHYLYVEDDDVQMLFDVMFLGQRKRLGKTVGNDDKVEYEYRSSSWGKMRCTLTWMSLSKYHFQEFRRLYWMRYDVVLEWWYQSFKNIKVEDVRYTGKLDVVAKRTLENFFRGFICLNTKAMVSDLQIELYNKLFQIFDERELPEEVKQIWVETKRTKG